MADSTAAVTHVKLRDIGPGNDNLSLRGVIIRKQEARMVRIRRGNIFTFIIQSNNLPPIFTLSHLFMLCLQTTANDVFGVLRYETVLAI